MTTTTAAPQPTSTDLGTFLMIVEQHPVGARLTVENLRDDLEAAQIPPSAYGPLFRAACQRGLLVHTGMSVVERKASRRGGRAGIYKRTRPKAAPAKTRRPTTTRTDQKGPRR